MTDQDDTAERASPASAVVALAVAGVVLWKAGVFGWRWYVTEIWSDAVPVDHWVLDPFKIAIWAAFVIAVVVVAAVAAGAVVGKVVDVVVKRLT